MPQTIIKTNEGRSTGKIFSHRENAANAIKVFQELVVLMDEKQAKDAYINLMVGRGFSESQSLYYDKTLRVVHEGIARENLTHVRWRSFPDPT